MSATGVDDFDFNLFLLQVAQYRVGQKKVEWATMGRSEQDSIRWTIECEIRPDPPC